VLDLIGAARPSIADPFLPKKIEEGRLDDIRECIGCNICLASNMLTVPIRCTQNPTMSEEWRRGWHPENIPRRGSSAKVLVVGAGPAGLEAARAAGARGYEVSLAEAGRELGGHLNAFAGLPGLAEWIRVRDWRVGQIGKMANVAVYRTSELHPDEVWEFGAEHVIIATGARWRRDGIGAHHYSAIPGHEQSHVLAPDDVLAGAETGSPVVVYDDDTYVMGGCLAEKLAQGGRRVTLVTPFPLVSSWTYYTLELEQIQRRLASLGIAIVAGHTLQAIGPGSVELAPTYGGPGRCLEAASLVLVTMRTPNDALYRALADDEGGRAAAGIRTLVAVGDCRAPGLLSEAVFAGHEAARALDGPDVSELPFRIEQVPASFVPPLPGTES
jgi:dimethylamine/trimethylamine dehydrogenase